MATETWSSEASSSRKSGISAFSKSKSERTDHDISSALRILKKCSFFNSMQRDELEMDLILTEAYGLMKCQSWKQGEIIFHHRDSPLNFYVIIEGNVDIYVPKTKEEIEEEALKFSKRLTRRGKFFTIPLLKPLHNVINFDTMNSLPKDEKYFQVCDEQIICKYKKVRTLGSGAHFGEFDLLKNCDRSATVIAASDLQVATLSKKGFNKIVRNFDESFTAKIDFFAKLMSRLPESSVARFSSSFKEKQLAYGQKIYTQGSIPTEIFIVRTGEVQLSVQEAPEKTSSSTLPSIPKMKKLPLEKIVILGPFSFLGLGEVLQNKPYEVTAMSYSNQTVLYAISIKEFKSLRNRYPDVFPNFADKHYKQMNYFKNRAENISSTMRNLSLDTPKASTIAATITDFNQVHSPKFVEKKLEKAFPSTIEDDSPFSRIRLTNFNNKETTPKSSPVLITKLNLNDLVLYPPTPTIKSPCQSKRESSIPKDSCVFPDYESGSMSHRQTPGQRSSRLQKEGSFSNISREFNPERTLKILFERAMLKKSSCTDISSHKGPRPGMFYKISPISPISSRKLTQKAAI